MQNDVLIATLKDIASFLNDQKIEYALIGGMAASVRGEPRSTLDVDIIINCDVERGLELIRLLDSSRFRPLFHGVEQVLKTGLLLPLAHRETVIKVDLALAMSGFEQGAIKESTIADIGAGLTPVVSAEYLVVMKQLASRPRDLDDISMIIARQGDAFDWPKAQQLASQLGQAIDEDLVSPLLEARRKFDKRQSGD
jgi:hypothetical protein